MIDFPCFFPNSVIRSESGGEGLFLGTLRGPGRVWLQTMTMSKLAQKIGQYMPQVGGQGQSDGLNINLGQLLSGE